MEGKHSQRIHLLKLIAWTVGLTLNGTLWGWFWLHVADYEDFLHRGEVQGALIFVPLLLLGCFFISLPFVGRQNRDRILRLPAALFAYPFLIFCLSSAYSGYTAWPSLTDEELAMTKKVGLDFPDENLNMGGTYFATTVHVEEFEMVIRAFESVIRNEKYLRFVRTPGGFELRKEGCMVYEATFEPVKNRAAEVYIRFATG